MEISALTKEQLEAELVEAEEEIAVLRSTPEASGTEVRIAIRAPRVRREQILNALRALKIAE